LDAASPVSSSCTDVAWRAWMSARVMIVTELSASSID